MKRIAIQGELGSFHDITAHQYFEGEQIEIICCATFEEVFENIKRDPTVVGICAIENTIAGSLLHNYELLRQSGTTVVGEHKLHIEHSICCLPEDDWSTLQEVHSHPVALMQCGKFLANHPDLKAVEAEDTAGSAAYIAQHKVRGWAAICSSYAAHMYGMKVLQEDIHDNPHNYTRFLVVCNPQKAALLRPIEKANKASIVFGSQSLVEALDSSLNLRRDHAIAKILLLAYAHALQSGLMVSQNNSPPVSFYSNGVDYNT